MWKFIILFCIRLQFVIANYDFIPEVKLNVVLEKEELVCRGTETNLLHNSLYRVHINYIQNIYHARCHKMYELNNAVADDFHPNMENRPGYMSTNGSIVTKLGEWYLQCSVYTTNCWLNDHQSNDYCYYGNEKHPDQVKIVKCYIPVTVLPAEFITAGLLTVDNFNIPAKAQHITKKHFVNEGHSINLICKKNVEGYVQLAYSNKEEDSRTFSTSLQTTGNIQQYMKVTAADDDAKITCTIYNKNKKILSDITVTLDVKGSPRTNTGFLGFVVNGLVLPQIANSGSGVYNYEYKYYHTEPLNISFVKDEKMYMDEYCIVNGNAPNSVQEYFRTHTGFNNKPVLTTVYQDHVHNIFCTVHNINGGANPTMALIKFVYKPPDYTPFISDLTKGNIMMALKNDTTTWIYYNYDENGLHDLRCFDNEFRSDSHTTWQYNRNEVYRRVDMNNLGTFKLLNVMSSVITCKSKLTGKVTNLKLIRKEAIDTNTITTQTTPHEVVTEIHTEQSMEGKQNGIVVGVSTAIIVVAALAVAITVCQLYRRRAAVPNIPSAADFRTDVEKTEEHIYESIPDVPSGPSSGAMTGISQGPPLLLPAEAIEECQQCVLYDVPYEWRIFPSREMLHDECTATNISQRPPLPLPAESLEENNGYVLMNRHQAIREADIPEVSSSLELEQRQQQTS